jgi:hypothetical protein
MLFVTRGSPQWFLSELTTAQKVSFLHSSYVWLSVALGHVGPSLQYFVEGPKVSHNLEQRLDVIEATLDSAVSETKFVLDNEFKNMQESEKKSLMNEMNLKLRDERTFYTQMMRQ